MNELCIQIHPHRSPGYNWSNLRLSLERLAAKEPLISYLAIFDGFDEHAYINIFVETGSLHDLWTILHARFYENHEFGGHLARASIAACQGNHGWDDYLLLHHLDPEERIDVIGAI